MVKEWSKDQQFTLYIGGDFHVGNANAHNRYPTSEEIQTSFQDAIRDGADAYLLMGDNIQSHASVEDFAGLVRPFSEQGLRIITILGNHEFFGDKIHEVVAAYRAAGIEILQDEMAVFEKGERRLGIVGAQQYPGRDVDTAISRHDAQSAFAAAHTARERFAQISIDPRVTEEIHVMHYGPIVGTDGSGDALIHYGQGYDQLLGERAKSVHVHAVFHGHSHGPFPHEGNLEGKTKEGIPVYNVAAPVRRRNGLPLAKIISI